MKRKKGNFLLGTYVILVVWFSLFPFFWFLLTSLKSPLEVTASPPTWWPTFNLDLYRSAIRTYGLFHFIKNSLIVAGLVTPITLSLATLAGYSLARLRLPHRGWIMGGLLLVSMFPQISIAGPVWSILRRLNWLNTYQGLIIPYVTLTLPLAVWILASFFKELPPDLEDAARVDGCSRFQTLLRIMVPLSLPGVSTAAILVFIYAWNEFFFALLVMTERAYQTLPVGIALFQGQYTVPWGEIAAASVVASVPLVLMVLLFQRKIVSGLSAGAVK